MRWELSDFKPGTVCYIARGKRGTFVVYKNATTRGKWAGGYDSKSKRFLLQPTSSLKRIQKYCRDNYYWEEEFEQINIVGCSSKYLDTLTQVKEVISPSTPIADEDLEWWQK